MTIMDRLARKGIVERRKVGRAYSYRANLSAEEARAHALAQVVENFFGGSKEALLAQLMASGPQPARATYPAAPRARAAAASSRARSGSSGQRQIFVDYRIVAVAAAVQPSGRVELKFGKTLAEEIQRDRAHRRFATLENVSARNQNSRLRDSPGHDPRAHGRRHRHRFSPRDSLAWAAAA